MNVTNQTHFSEIVNVPPLDLEVKQLSTLFLNITFVRLCMAHYNLVYVLLHQRIKNHQSWCKGFMSLAFHMIDIWIFGLQWTHCHRVCYGIVINCIGSVKSPSYPLILQRLFFRYWVSAGAMVAGYIWNNEIMFCHHWLSYNNWASPALLFMTEDRQVLAIYLSSTSALPVQHNLIYLSSTKEFVDAGIRVSIYFSEDLC